MTKEMYNLMIILATGSSKRGNLPNTKSKINKKGPYGSIVW